VGPHSYKARTQLPAPHRPTSRYHLSIATIHIPEAEALANFPALLERVRAGEEFVVHDGAKSIAVIRQPITAGRPISESIAMAEAYSKELGNKPVMDEDFAADMEEIIRNHKPADRSA
jgi:antitoxin (DNA-binding transcriptional repressor) of toxin-antitoxin stability system